MSSSFSFSGGQLEGAPVEILDTIQQLTEQIGVWRLKEQKKSSDSSRADEEISFASSMKQEDEEV
jgi:hypothetical protein